jgi:tight adherence protein C
MDFSSDTIIVIVSALAAAASFIAFAVPFLKSAEKKERYKSVIEKRRKDLLQQTKDEMANRGKAQQTVSARESVATAFKVQKMLGAMGEKARTLMLQAGIRSPSAPFKFIIARFLLPVFLCLFAMFIISRRDAGLPADTEHMSNAMKMIWLMVAAFVGYKLPGLMIKNQIQKRTQEIGITFPDALDMMLICVQGGIGLEQTVDRIADEMAEHSEILAEELGILSAEMAMLSDRRMALQDFARRVGSPSARSFATALIQAEQYGTSVTNAMRIMSEELREQRMALAEQKAASLPPKLTVPMIAFFLPVLFVVILGPAVLKFTQSRSK